MAIEANGHHLACIPLTGFADFAVLHQLLQYPDLLLVNFSVTSKYTNELVVVDTDPDGNAACHQAALQKLHRKLESASHKNARLTRLGGPFGAQLANTALSGGPSRAELVCIAPGGAIAWG